MKIRLIGEPKIIISNPNSKFNYFAWPTAARLQNGKIAVAASGFRRRHVCPFGKMVISYSEDGGETYTYPAPVIDTPLDDRDGGILAFGESNVMVTSFNNTVEFQRNTADSLDNAYLDTISADDESKYLGSLFRVSKDFGVTFGPIHKCPVTAPHGPIELRDGTILYVGRTFSRDDSQMNDDCIKVYKINPETGESEYLSSIENVVMDGITPLSCEPHAIQIGNKILVHIRIDRDENDGNGIFTLFQTESEDNGKTWTKPHQLLANEGGAPAHLFMHSSGVLICTYTLRGIPGGVPPFGIKAMFSKDEGKTWDVDNDLYVTDVTDDIGYPSTVELDDGSLITIFYARDKETGNNVIMQQKWSFDD